MTLTELYAQAEDNGIEIDDFRTKEIISASFPEGWIVMDSTKIDSSIQEKVILAHEIGHIETGSFYNSKSRCDTRGRHERRADRYAFSLLVPEKDFFKAIKKGYCECWELADYFDVTCEFMYKAMEYYHEKQLARG